LAVAYPEDTAQLTDLLPEHNEVFGYCEADNQEPPLRVGRSHMRFDRAFLIAFNLLARLFGAIGILAGIIFLVSAYAIEENRVLDIVVGLFAIVMGIAFLVTKSVNAELLARIRRRLGHPGSPES
jgi:hypothetical protein